MIVVDASVLLTALLDAGASGALARQVLRDDEQRHAPDLVDIEVVSGIRGRLRGGHLRIDDALTAVTDLRDHPLRRNLPGSSSRTSSPSETPSPPTTLPTCAWPRGWTPPS